MDNELPVSKKSSPRVEPIATPSGRARVLVVDDNKDLALGLARLLEIHGHHVQVAFDGPACVDKAKEWRPEFVLLDIGLPGMDGYQVAALLQQDPDTREAVLIAISGYGHEPEERRSQQAGFDHHLVKPFSSGDLIKLLESPRQGRRAPP